MRPASLADSLLRREEKAMIVSVLAALAPVLLLLAFGVLMRRRAFLAEGFWPQAERLCYFVLLPALFTHGLATAKLGELPVAAMTACLVISTVLVAGVVVAARPWIKADGPAFTSIFQGAVRFNNYVGVSLAVGLFGAQGLAFAAVCNAAVVPTVNVLSVLVFARYGGAKLDARGVARQIATNPLLLACALGAALQASGVGLPFGFEPALKALGAASLPLGLLCVGAALDFSQSRSWGGPVAIASFVKFLALPAAAAALGALLGLKGPALATAILFQTLPTASSSYILARQLGGDAPLMAGITAAQTVIAFAAIPIVDAALIALLS